jgi:4,5-dihydroxyphthalate decarboxylase
MSEHRDSRRDFLKLAGLSAAGIAASVTTGAAVGDDKTGEVPGIKVAGYDYDRVKGIMDGRAALEKVSFHYEDIYSVNGLAFGNKQTYEVSELGLIPFVTQYVNDEFREYTLIPVFISRIFRHRNVFVASGSGIEKPEDLRGKTVGTPGYGMSANTWIRGFLKDEYGVEADEMQWVETTKSSDAGELQGSSWSAFDEEGNSPYFLPSGFPLKPGPPGVDESELLLSGKCDALITAITPRAFMEGNPGIRRLFPDVKKTEQSYYEKTGLFPIMHVVGIRTNAINEDPSLPMAVYKMYEEAKQLAYADLETTTSLKVSLPWVTQEFESTRELMGDDYWRYGIASNEKELDLVMRYTHEQGLVKERMDFRGMFHPSTLAT